MLFDFEKVEEQELPQFKGGEGVFRVRMVTDEKQGVKLMRGRLFPGCSIGFHTHTGDMETVYVLSGRGSVLLDGGRIEPISAGQCHVCLEGCGHSLRCEDGEPLCFFAVVQRTAG